jgi:hypothetical protein
MVAGIHKYLDRELAASVAKRDELWKADLASKEALAKSLPAKRERLRKMLGVVDERVKPALEYISGPGKPSLLAEIDGCKIHVVRWAVLPGVDAEGLLIEPKDKPKANVVAVPHADQLPEDLAGLTKGDDFGLRLEMLERVVPSPINTLNRAIAIAEWQGPDAGLALIEPLRPPTWLLGYYLWDATLGELYRHRGDQDRATAHLTRALSAAPTHAEKELIRRRLEAR